MASPTFVVDVSAQYDVKRAALDCYASQIFQPSFCGTSCIFTDDGK